MECNLPKVCGILTVTILNIFFAAKNSKANKIWARNMRTDRCDNKPLTRYIINNITYNVPTHTDKRALSKPRVGREFDFCHPVPAEDSLVRETSKLPQIDNYVRFYSSFGVAFSLYIVVKNIIIMTLDYESMHEYRYLDCYLVGRFMYDGRVIDRSSEFHTFLELFLVLWTANMYLKLPKIKLMVIEFLLMNKSEVAAWEQYRLSSQTKPSSAPKKAFRLYYSTIFDFTIPPYEDRGTVCCRCQREGEKNQLKKPTQDYMTHPFMLRPNRTLASWRRISRVASVYTMAGVFFSCCAVTYFLVMNIPLYIDNRGFDLTHRHCVDWIVEKANSYSDKNISTNPLVDLAINYRQIMSHRDLDSYRPPLPYKSIFQSMSGSYVELNIYHILRIIVNLLDNLISYHHINAILIGNAVLVSLMVCDLMIYCESIDTRLETLTHRQRHLFLYGQHHGKYPAAGRVHSAEVKIANGLQISRDFDSHARKLTDEIQTIQAMIMDLFNLIGTYNQYLSLQLIHLITFWLCYSAMVSGWIFIPAVESPKLEWYLLHGFATIYMLYVIVPLARVRIATRRIYNLMTISMAYDGDIKGTKLTWQTLLDFYAPKPLYCVKIFGSVEISIFFAFKLIAWLFSALFVVSTFFTTYNMSSSGQQWVKSSHGH